MCRLIKSNKLVVLTLYSSYLYPLVQVLRSVLDQDLLNKPHHISHTDTLIFNSELYCLSISSSSFLPTIHHVQASSRCAHPKYALHAPSYIILVTQTLGSDRQTLQRLLGEECTRVKSSRSDGPFSCWETNAITLVQKSNLEL